MSICLLSSKYGIPIRDEFNKFPLFDDDKYIDHIDLYFERIT